MYHHKRRFGQHFLADTHAIQSIVAAISPLRNDRMIEIGPGLGALTHALRPHLDALTVIEVDLDLVDYWHKQQGVRVIASDVLKVDFSGLQTSSQPLRLVGNLPYNISSPILFHLLPWADLVADQHFMLQKEVVDRMVASPCTAAYGRLSVMLQWRYEMTALLDVPPAAFDPPPKVMSAVVRMTPRAQAAVLDYKTLEDVVRMAFSQRRKLLRHSLGKWLADKGVNHNFDLQRRAEEVAVDEYIQLAQTLTQTSH